MSYALPFVALAAMLLSGPLLAVASAGAPEGPILLIVAPPWLPVSEIAARAGARSIDPFDAPLGGLVTASGPADPGLAEALSRAGAWAVLDGSRLAAICGVTL
ncbi:MAG: hypothetical protein AAF264_02030 [Pseudomonadota bacterium]